MYRFIQFLTYFRIFSGPLIFMLVVLNNSYILAMILFALASISDYLDGYFARKYKLVTEFGAILDPVADKILLSFLLVTLTLSLNSAFIGFFGSIILTREFWVAGLRESNSRINNQLATKVTNLSKIKTAVQFLALFLYLLCLETNSSLLLLITNLVFFIAMILTIQTGLTYTQGSFNKSEP